MLSCDKASCQDLASSAAVWPVASPAVGGTTGHSSTRVILPLTSLTYEACETEAGSKCVVCNSRTTKLSADMVAMPPLVASDMARISHGVIAISFSSDEIGRYRSEHDARRDADRPLVKQKSGRRLDRRPDF